MIVQILQPEIEALIASRDLVTLKEILLDWTPADLAELINEIPENEQAIIFRLLPKETATETFEYLDIDSQLVLIQALRSEETASILNEMSRDDRTALLEELPATVAKQLISLLSVEERAIAQTLLGYPENSIGRLMTPDYIAVRAEWTVKDVLDYIREHGNDSETLNIIYVIDAKGKLIDDLKIRDFLLAPLDKKVSELMDENFIYLEAYDDQETAVEIFKKYDRVALPVTDKDGLLIGIVTVDDMLDVAEEEATEDIHKLGGVTAFEEPYSTISIYDVFKKRVFWLSMLFVAQTLTAIAMGFFEDELSKAVVLSIFIPLIISSGGNSGSQAATLVIRAMALGEITIRDWWLIMRRDLLSGLLLGSVIGAIGFVLVQVLSFSIQAVAEHNILIGFTVCVSLIGIVLWGSLSGSMLPFILKKIGLDPATSSAPLVATLVDVTGLIIYFTAAALILTGTLL